MNWFEQAWTSLEMPIRLGDTTLAFSWLSVILEWILPLVAVLVVFILLHRFVVRRIRTTDLPVERQDKLVSWIRLGLRLLWAAILILLSLRFMEYSVLGIFEDIFTFLGTPFYTSGSTRVSALTLILAVPVILLANVAGKASRLALDRSRIFGGVLTDARRFTVANLVRYGVMLVTLLVGLSIIGLDLTAIMVLLGIFGVGIGFGLQHVLANFFAGLVIIVNRPFKEGDHIRLAVNGQVKEGVVRAVHLVNTLLSCSEGESLIVPNSQMMGNAVNNLSYQEAMPVFTLELRIPRTVRIGETRSEVLRLAALCPVVDRAREARVLVNAIASDAVELLVELPLQGVSHRAEARIWILEELALAAEQGKLRVDQVRA